MREGKPLLSPVFFLCRGDGELDGLEILDLELRAAVRTLHDLAGHRLRADADRRAALGTRGCHGGNPLPASRWKPHANFTSWRGPRRALALVNAGDSWERRLRHRVAAVDVHDDRAAEELRLRPDIARRRAGDVHQRLGAVVRAQARQEERLLA